MTVVQFTLSVFVGVTAFAADGFVGAQACRPCHPSQFQRQTATGHARTLARAAEHSLAGSFSSGSKLRGRFEFLFENQNGLPRTRIRDARSAASEIEIPIDWAFGSGTHGVTFVSRLSRGTYLEHAFSFYSDRNLFDITPGHRRLPSGTAMEAAGQILKIVGSGGAMLRCFQCHSTGRAGVTVGQEVTLAELGVRCEACHGAGERHARAANAGNSEQIRSTIRNPRSLPAGEVLNLCGTCHQPPDGRDVPNDFANPWNVRHQPPYLQQSKCFQASGDRLTCLTCHAPHDALRRSDADYYRQKCIACHGPGRGREPSAICKADSQPDCTGCHMPAVRPDPNLQFRNHWIGVYRAGASLVPAR